MGARTESTEDSESLQRRIADLERRLALKDRAFRQSYDEFQALIFSVTHDFRSPLRAILSTCMILKEDYGDAIGTEGLAELERQAGNARRLNGLLEQLLRISRLANFGYDPQETSIAKVARQAAAEVGEAAQSALTVESDMVVKADPDLLRIALMQLFENSINFADPSRALQISIACVDGAVRVTDNGIGFDDAKAERIFLPFERLNREEPPGAGMGLSIFKRIIDRHGGTVGFESVPGRGATIWFRLDG